VEKASRTELSRCKPHSNLMFIQTFAAPTQRQELQLGLLPTSRGRLKREKRVNTGASPDLKASAGVRVFLASKGPDTAQHHGSTIPTV
jgi:hypothetical protein